MPTTVVDVVVLLDGALSAGVLLLSVAGAVVVVVELSIGRGVCITVVKSVPVTSDRWFAESVLSWASTAGDVRCRANRSAASSDPGAYLITVCGVDDAL